MRRLVLATKNKGKIVEFERLLSQHAQSIKVLGLADFPDMPDVQEIGKTLGENARLKARPASGEDREANGCPERNRAGETRTSHR